ncbi:hypothetical protein SAMN05428936_11617 [Pelagibacterium halotolerans]|nr:hypothetical protein SAMN05428936_11617 [Pelagibacterium halotolerans]
MAKWPRINFDPRMGSSSPNSDWNDFEVAAYASHRCCRDDRYLVLEPETGIRRNNW